MARTKAPTRSAARLAGIDEFWIAKMAEAMAISGSL
jgi:hypothetical protein